MKKIRFTSASLKRFVGISLLVAFFAMGSVESISAKTVIIRASAPVMPMLPPPAPMPAPKRVVVVPRDKAPRNLKKANLRMKHRIPAPQPVRPMPKLR